MGLSIIIVNWNVSTLLSRCLHSLSDLELDSYEIIVVDNASSDDSVRMIKRNFPSVKLIVNEKNMGFAYACNQGIKEAKGQYVLLLNPDTIVPKGSIEVSLGALDKSPDVAILGCELRDKEGNVQRSVSPFPTPIVDILSLLGAVRLLRIYQGRRPTGILAVRGFLTGAFLLVRRSAIEAVGLLDDSIFMYGEDVDWCYRFYKAGWAIGYYPEAWIIHVGNQSGQKAFGEKRLELLYKGIMHFQHKYFPAYYRLGPFIRGWGLVVKMVAILPLIWLSPALKRKMQEYSDAFVANYRAALGR